MLHHHLICCRRHFLDQNCSSGATKVAGYRGGACIPFNFSVYEASSERYDYPRKYRFEGVLDCSGTPEYMMVLPPLVGQCMFNEFDFDYISTALTNNVTAPDLAPAPFPSAASPRKHAAAMWLTAAVLMMACCASMMMTV